MRITAFAAAGLLSIPVAAQTAPCEKLNETSTNLRPIATFLGTNTWGYEIIPQQGVTVQSLRIFTDNRFTAAHMALAIHDVEPATSLPAANPRGRGVWAVDTARGPAWQGCNLDRSVSLTGGGIYWLVWEEPGGSTPPFDTAGPTVPVARLVNGAWTRFGGGAVKYQLYCGLLDNVNVANWGNSCTNSLGSQGTLFTNELPTVGNASYAVEASGFPPGEAAVLLFGFTTPWPVIPLSPLHFSTGCTWSSEAFVSFGSATAGPGGVCAGHLRFPLGIPNDPNLLNLSFSNQLGVFDSGPGQVVTSNTVQSTVF